MTKAILNSNETPEQRQARWESMVEERREKGERTIKLVRSLISLPKEATLRGYGGGAGAAGGCSVRHVASRFSINGGHHAILHQKLP